MADRFWVGGGSAANWAATGNTNWAATSGGANNASVPGVGDVAIFDALSGSGSSAISASITVQKLIAADYVGTLLHNNACTLTLNTAAADTLVLGPSMIYTPATSSGLITLTNTSGTADLTTNGKRLGGLTVNGSGGTVRMLDALRVDLTATSLFTLTVGIFNGNGFAVAANSFSSNNTNTRSLLMGGGDWTIGGAVSAGATIWNLGTITGLTFTKGASNIIVPSNGLAGTRIFAGGGLTYNGLTVAANSGRGAISLTGANTFAGLSLGEGNMLELPVSGTTTLQTAPNWVGTPALPILVNSLTLGTLATLSVPSGDVTLDYGGLRDVTGTGGATFAATNAYDHGNNIGWAISAPPIVPSLADIADAVWDELLAGHAVAGSAGEALTSAAAGGGGLDAAGVRAAVGLASASLDTQLGGIDTKAGNIQSRLPAALVGGRIDASIGAVAAGAIAAASFAANALDAVWSTATRVLTAGTNIVLAKGTGLTGLNDLSAAQVNTEVDTALADYDGPTHAEMTTALAAADDAVLAAIDAVPTANENADALLDRADGVESGLTVRQHHRLEAAVLYGPATGINTASKSFRDKANTKSRVAVTQAGGDRDVTLDAT